MKTMSGYSRQRASPAHSGWLRRETNSDKDNEWQSSACDLALGVLPPGTTSGSDASDVALASVKSVP
jgi:hypothetical protein